MNHTEETKNKIRASRIKYFQENPDKHPWKRKDKFNSIPCEFFKNKLRDARLDFKEEFQPLADRFFSIDIAFPNKLLGIEINGNQHYKTDGTLKAYYQERHNLIMSNGWKLLEVHYARVYDNDFIDELIEFVSGQKTTAPAGMIIDQHLIMRRKKEAMEKRKIAAKEARIKKIQVRSKMILESNIDFQSFGWVSRVAKMLNISHTQVRRFIQKNMPDFYLKCYVRTPVSPQFPKLQKE